MLIREVMVVVLVGQLVCVVRISVVGVVGGVCVVDRYGEVVRVFGFVGDGGAGDLNNICRVDGQWRQWSCLWRSYWWVW